MNIFQKWMEKIKDSNKSFGKANKARKRVMIAKDIIAALEVELFKASGESGYVKILNADWTQFSKFNAQDDYRDKVIASNVQCDVCAKGAIFMCTLMRRDNITIEQKSSINWRGQYSYGLSLSDALGGIFSQEQLNLIEGNYECGRRGVANRVPGSPFGKYNKGRDRLIAIMKNIVKHGGTFKPELEV